LEYIEGGISITDLTFYDFKIDEDRLILIGKQEFNLMPKSILCNDV